MTDLISRYRWRDGDGAEDGYRVQSSTGHWCWLSREDAWDAANELAELLSEDLAKLEATE